MVKSRRATTLALGVGEQQLQPSCTSGLRCYRNPRAAREAHRRAHFRVRTFTCPSCNWVHVTAEGLDK